MSNINIGITICLKEENESLWTNGIKLNALFLARMFMNSTENYNVFIVNTSDIKITNKLGWDIEKYKTVLYSEYKDKIDIMIPLGGGLNHENVKYLQDRGCKVISYKCGNDYIINMENIIFGRMDNTLSWPKSDEIWSIPQLMNTNKDYWRLIQGVETVKEVPFVWHHMFLDDHINVMKKEGKDAFYKPSNGIKRISVFEPNINVVKFAMYPILILQELFNQHPELKFKAKITNTQKIRKSKQFISLMKHLSIEKNGLISFEDRFPMAWFLAEHTDIVLSHQWENPLNYAYLDALYMGYPLVHNAYMIKDVGYYYDGFDVKDGYEKLKYAIKYHDDNLNDYKIKTDKLLWKYNADNPEVIQQYDLLIKNLLKK